MARNWHGKHNAPFGVHITLDGYNGCPARLSDFDHIKQCLSELPTQLGMHKLVEPTVLEVGELSLKDPGGITGFVLIAESHISIHTFPRRGFLSADVYTCQGTLKKQWIRSFFARSFGLKDIETNYLIRGSCYPKSNIA